MAEEENIASLYKACRELHFPRENEKTFEDDGMHQLTGLEWLQKVRAHKA